MLGGVSQPVFDLLLVGDIGKCGNDPVTMLDGGDMIPPVPASVVTAAHVPKGKLCLDDTYGIVKETFASDTGKLLHQRIADQGTLASAQELFRLLVDESNLQIDHDTGLITDGLKAHNSADRAPLDGRE